MTDLEKDRSELERVTDEGSKKKNEVDRLTAQIQRESKLDEIADRQEVTIRQLERSLEKVLLEKGRREHNSVEAEDIVQEIADLQLQVDDAQYGLGDVDEHGRELATGEQREIERIEN